MATMTKEQLTDLIRETVQPLLAEAIDPLKAQQTQNMAPVLEGATGMQPRRPDEHDQRGLLAARVVSALAAAGRNNYRGAIEFATQRWGKHSATVGVFEKALAAGTASAGGMLIGSEVSEDLIELLRPASVVRSLNPMMVPLDSGTLGLPKVTGGATGSYIGENANIPVGQQQFGTVVLNARKLAVLTPISNDLIRRAGPRSEAIVRDDLVAGIATRSDLAFITGSGVNGEPRGLRQWAPASHVLTANSSATLDNVTNDLRDMLVVLMVANVRMLRPGWIMGPRVWGFLATIRDGNGNYAFRDELLGGRFWGMPYGRTAQVENEIYLADFADVVIGEATSILLDVSDTAAYHDGSNVVAAFSLDQTVVRAIVEHDLVMRHTESIAVLTDVTWGS